MEVRREAAQTGMATRRATGGFRRRTRQYVEESDRAQRSRHARIQRRSRSFMNNADLIPDSEVEGTLPRFYAKYLFENL